MQINIDTIKKCIENPKKIYSLNIKNHNIGFASINFNHSNILINLQILKDVNNISVSQKNNHYYNQDIDYEMIGLLGDGKEVVLKIDTNASDITSDIQIKVN